MDKKQIFSQEALDKMRSPEQLDMMLPITTPNNWIVIAAVCMALFSILLWSIFGAFTETASGMGLITDSAGVANISHIAGGKVTEVYVNTGSVVKKGDLIAKIEQAAQTADTRMAMYNMELASNDRDAMNKVYQYDAKKYQQDINEEIYSDYDGIVDSLLVGPGTIINSGAPICTVRLTQDRDELTGIFFIPVDKGKRVEPGMTIQLAPNGVDVSQSGSLLGVVRSVSKYPVSGEEVQNSLGNAHLAQWILSQEKSSVMRVEFDLVKDKDSESGYLWTSVVGEHKPITAGSFCMGSIVIERIPPLQKIFYKLSQWLRSR